ASSFVNVIATIVGAMVSLISMVPGLDGLSKGFSEAERAAASFGAMVGLALSVTVIGSIVKMISHIAALAMSFVGLGKVSPLAFGVIGVAILALAPHFDAIVGWIGNVISKLEALEVAGISAFDVLATGGLLASTKGGRKGIGTVATKAAPWLAPLVTNPAVLTGAGIIGGLGWGGCQ